MWTFYLEDFPSGKGPVITWWDCGTAQGTFDDEDVLYLDNHPFIAGLSPP